MSNLDQFGDYKNHMKLTESLKEILETIPDEGLHQFITHEDEDIRHPVKHEMIKRGLKSYNLLEIISRYKNSDTGSYIVFTAFDVDFVGEMGQYTRCLDNITASWLLEGGQKVEQKKAEQLEILFSHVVD